MPSILDQHYFRDEAAAYAKLESIIWPNGPVCVHCGETNRIGLLKGNATRPGLYKCYACRKQFRVTVGTVFEASHIALRHWLQAVYLVVSSKKGVSSNQLHRTMGITLKSAWFMSHRIRRMVEKDSGEKHASLSDQQGIILDFPPLKEAATISGIRQATSFDGILLRTGGAGTYASLLMQNLAGETVAGFAVQRSLAKSMAHLLYEPIRVHGLGSWDRTPEGEWKLAKMLVQTFEVLEDEGLVDVVRRLQTAPVIWPPDADAQLKAEREQV